MKPLIDPIDKKRIKAELTPERFIRITNAGNNAIYLLNAHNSPNTMLEIGRLRELTFREAGGGTGKEADIDEFDTAENPFNQLIVWNNEEEEIIGAYRFITGREAPIEEEGYPHTPTSKLFLYSEKFIQNQWQECIELGRSFVQPKYQATSDVRGGLYALDNIWDGLGALTVMYPKVKYFIGKMTLYNRYNRRARNLIIHFLNKHFKGDEALVRPRIPFYEPSEEDENYRIFSNRHASVGEDFKLLNRNIRELNEIIPPLIKTYISLASTMQYFGSSPNIEFGPVEELCIMINIADIYDSKKARHIQTYK